MLVALVQLWMRAVPCCMLTLISTQSKRPLVIHTGGACTVSTPGTSPRSAAGAMYLPKQRTRNIGFGNEGRKLALT